MKNAIKLLALICCAALATHSLALAWDEFFNDNQIENGMQRDTLFSFDDEIFDYGD